MIDKKELSKAIKILKDSKSISEDLINTLQNIVDEEDTADDDTVELIDKNKYFATILWQNEDIRSMLKEHNIPISKENIDKIFDELDTTSMEDCSHGWDIMEDAFDRAFAIDEIFGEEI